MFMNEEAIKAITDGMKEAGISVVAMLSTHRIYGLLNAIEEDPDFDHVLVGNEGDAIGICAGAWLGGKMGAFVGQNSGLLLATYQLHCSISFFGGFPFLMLIDQKGAFGEHTFIQFYSYAIRMREIMQNLDVPYTTVAKTNELRSGILNGVKTARGFMRPACVFLEGEDLYGYD